jgi:hypothetical protein
VEAKGYRVGTRVAGALAGAVAFAVVAVAGAHPALAAPRSNACVSHSISVTPLGDRTMLDTYVDNECGSDQAITVTYRIDGPCPHLTTIRQTVAPGAWDLVTTYQGPCAGHYTARQRITASGHLAGEDTTEFDAPG